VEQKKKQAIKVLIIVKHINKNYPKLPVCTVCVLRFHLWICIVFVLQDSGVNLYCVEYLY
jgi:hypothetical protein